VVSCLSCWVISWIKVSSIGDCTDVSKTHSTQPEQELTNTVIYKLELLHSAVVVPPTTFHSIELLVRIQILKKFSYCHAISKPCYPATHLRPNPASDVMMTILGVLGDNIDNNQLMNGDLDKWNNQVIMKARILQSTDGLGASLGWSRRHNDQREKTRCNSAKATCKSDQGRMKTRMKVLQIFRLLGEGVESNRLGRLWQKQGLKPVRTCNWVFYSWSSKKKISRCIFWPYSIAAVQTKSTYFK